MRGRGATVMCVTREVDGHALLISVVRIDYCCNGLGMLILMRSSSFEAVRYGRFVVVFAVVNAKAVRCGRFVVFVVVYAAECWCWWY